MDLGIKGKKALVCASSRGLGLGCARALAEAGVDLVMNGRDADVLDQAAAAVVQDFGVSVIKVACDVSTQDGQAQLLEAASGVDILVNNAGGPPPGSWRGWSREDFQAAIDANMLAPIALMQGVLPGMIDIGWGRVVNITSQAVRAPIPVLGLSNTARLGLTGFVAGTARQVAEYGVAINNLLPGLHDTDRATSLDQGAAAMEKITLSEARAAREATIPARRYGTPEEFGATCAFLCSQYAGFIIGQNVMLDGGAANIAI